MDFHLIDIEKWDRKEHYLTYISQVPCTYSMTVTLDVTKLLINIKQKSISFYPTIIYAVSNIINNHKEFRMSLNDDGYLGYYDIVNPSYTIFHKDTETFSNIWTEYNEDFKQFYNNYCKDIEIYGENKKFNPKPPISNTFNFSSIPWTSFTGFNLNLQKGYTYFPPIITIGRYTSENEKILLPMSIQVNHAVCDGFHVARFVNELQILVDNIKLY